jgi:hypothetical protein
MEEEAYPERDVWLDDESPQSSLLGAHLWPILWLLWEIESGDGDPSPDTKAKKMVYKREWAWEFICSWSDDFFKRQYRVSRDVFDDLCDRAKRVYPGVHADGLENYRLSQVKNHCRIEKVLHHHYLNY